MDIGVKITLNGKEEELIFTTAALKAVQEKFGGMSEMVDAFSGAEINEWDDGETRAAKLKAKKEAETNTLDIIWWLVALLSNQGRLLKNTKAQLLSEAEVGLLLLPYQVEGVMNSCMEAIAKGTGTYHAQAEEKASDPILEEVQKNVEGAGN